MAKLILKLLITLIAFAVSVTTHSVAVTFVIGALVGFSYNVIDDCMK